MLITQQTWQLSTTSTSGAAVNGFGQMLENSFYVSGLGGSSANAIQIQTSVTSTGPFVTIASTTLTTAGTAALMQVTGPFLWIRPLVQGVAGTVQIDWISNGD